MKKCVIWGMGTDYEKLLNQLLFEIYKGNIQIEAIVCREQDKYCNQRDGFSVVTKEDLEIQKLDYVIVTSSLFYEQIKKEATELGFKEQQIIDGHKFFMPWFDFKRYVQLVEKPVTIFSDDCWGGYVYHRLGLPFSSPLINILWDREDYSNFILDPFFYLDQELKLVREGNLSRSTYPIGCLGDESRKVQVQFVHVASFAEAKEQWDIRKKRVNRNNIFVKMGFESTEAKKKIYLDAFDKVPYKKILFYNGEETVENVYKTNRFLNQHGRIDWFSYNDFVRSHYLLGLDIFKLLTGENDYLREIN